MPGALLFPVVHVSSSWTIGIYHPQGLIEEFKWTATKELGLLVRDLLAHSKPKCFPSRLLESPIVKVGSLLTNLEKGRFLAFPDIKLPTNLPSREWEDRGRHSQLFSKTIDSVFYLQTCLSHPLLCQRSISGLVTASLISVYRQYPAQGLVKAETRIFMCSCEGWMPLRRCPFHQIFLLS